MARALWFRPRTVWLPTWRTCLLTIALVGGVSWIFLTQIHAWLCRNEPLPQAKYIAVEGWAPDSVPTAAVQWAKQHEIARFFTTGTPIERGAIDANAKTYAEFMAHTLQLMGVDRARITPAPAIHVRTERTREMARALSAILEAEQIPAADRQLLIFTHSTHARRSLMHFRHELGPGWQVGIVAVPETSYPASRWWLYSDGVKSVTNELLGLIVQSVGGN